MGFSSAPSVGQACLTTARSILVAIRLGFGLSVTLRPVWLLPGMRSPLAGRGPWGIDVVVRETTEGDNATLGGITFTMPFWNEGFAAIGQEYPDVRQDQFHNDILSAIERVLAEGSRTRDLGGRVGTREVGEAIAAIRLSVAG